MCGKIFPPERVSSAKHSSDHSKGLQNAGFHWSWDCETLAKTFSRKISLLRQTPGYVLIRELWPDGDRVVCGVSCLRNTNVIYYTACPQLSCLCENFWREKLLMASIIEIISQHYVTLTKLNETNTERIAVLWERLGYWDRCYLLENYYNPIFWNIFFSKQIQRFRDWHGRVRSRV